ncbi:phosphoenolpyruvate phosphomutase-like isoform X2 [Bacillus rossius redtenbacheri]|uniref:phosphoenolpyruvate phosphomutase-like isoform X2 n=1 Tax=Bacillus rossius redtenbacheri TaxID=93214 RepID=UPI002FDD1EA5
MLVLPKLYWCLQQVCLFSKKGNTKLMNKIKNFIPSASQQIVAGLRRYAGAGQGKRTTRLKAMLASPDLAFLMEAHSGLSATIVEEAGFQGIWASGLSISAQLGVRDSNEASWTQVLEVVEFMADATSVPILLDADTGYGNFNNARRLVRKLEERGVAGCCIEDKCFPKTNSLLSGRRQPLADTQEFALKIRPFQTRMQARVLGVQGPPAGPGLLRGGAGGGLHRRLGAGGGPGAGRGLPRGRGRRRAHPQQQGRPFRHPGLHGPVAGQGACGHRTHQVLHHSDQPLP